ncbi:hypothetical protein L1987_57398 [Smallanthus sonchifolius]|uniref:Uncharacterized protein n=1 Tax=Smallanthus sonchifolius TaxID=185202 RepID=A0ACB9DCH5_9ASTR|nr:hypothetical protein L1987_57398 [Smallanthus sonchifolius]
MMVAVVTDDGGVVAIGGGVAAWGHAVSLFILTKVVKHPRFDLSLRHSVGEIIVPRQKMAAIGQNEEDEEVEFEKNNLTIVPTTLATIESLTFPLVQEVVLLADFRCKNCQDRVADIVSRLNGETESMEISLMEKKVTITLSSRHTKRAKMSENKVQPVASYKNRANKFSLMKSLFCSSSR